MNESLEELACLYVLDQLDTHQRAVFQARLIREPELATFVRELESTLSRSIHALPQTEPPLSLLGRVEAQIAAPGLLEKSLPSHASRSTISWPSFARWGLAALIALSLTTIAVQSLRRSPTVVFVGLDSNRNIFAELSLGNSAKDPDARFIELASLAQKLWKRPGELPVKVDLTLAEGRGYALIDPSSKQGFIAVEQLPAIRENQRFHLWVLDPASGQTRDAGVLPLTGSNSGLFSFVVGPVDDPKSARPHVFITVEDGGAKAAPDQPRGKVVLGDRGI
jgi:anti-sigma-K factor RskA